MVGCEDAARISLLNILTARGDIDLEKLKFAVYDFTSMYTKFTHKMIMTQMTNYIDVTSTATSRSSTTSVQRERSAPWTTRGRVETNISPHGLLFFNGLWQRYISSRCVVFPTSFLQRRAEQRRVFAPPCVHPRAGRQCIALTKRKACRASLLWAKRRRGGAVWSNLTST